MEWTDEGFVLSARRHGEGGAVVALLTRGHGRHAGFVRGGAGRRARGILQTGNLVSARWRARLDEHLGAYGCELLRAYAALLMTRRLPLLALASAAATLELLLPEREPHPGVFDGFRRLVEDLAGGDGRLDPLARWERDLLSDLGYGLDLSRCAVTGSAAGLAWVSPRTGRAVSRDAAGPWRERLLPLPPFLGPRGGPAGAGDVLDGLRLTGHFLARCARDAAAGGLPDARSQLVDRLRRDATISGG